MEQDFNEHIAETVKRHESELIRYATSILKNRDSALDAVQETFIKYVLISQDSPKGGIDNIRAWLYKTLRNRCIDVLRSISKRQEDGTELNEGHKELSVPLNERPDKGLENEDMMDFVRKQIDKLQEREREVLLLKIDHEKSYKEIAELMNITVGNVGFILHNAIGKIREAIKVNENEVQLQ